jgi:hypothetical protein
MPPSPESASTAAWQILVPRGAQPLSDAELAGLRRATVETFARDRVELLQAISSALLAHPRLRRDPAAAALGFWLRRSHLAELEADFRAGAAGHLRVPAGLVLHITPANVDTMFMLSWGLSFLAGNANLVRLTTSLSPLMQDLLACLDTAFTAHPQAARGNYFISYSHDDALTERLSAVCDQRIVWGGDETVRRIRAIPLNPHAGERSFASKRSLSVIAADAYRNASPAVRRQLAERMAADIVPFGQKACSSPHVIYWLGGGAGSGAVERDFTTELETVLAARNPEPDLADAVRRIGSSFTLAASGRVSNALLQPNTSQLTAMAPELAEQPDPCGAGLLVHASCASVEEIAKLIGTGHQTVTHFGLDGAAVAQLAILAGRAGVDRVVPIGRALEFTPTWDGYNLWTDLTRTVVVP